jgi:predicted AlkP superfamily pyrophosphatase or phosphodiesterase
MAVTRRVVVVVVAGLALAGAAAYALQPERGVPDGAPTQDRMAQSLGADVMQHIFRGHVPGRSAEIMLVPKPHHFILGEWDLTTLGTETLDLSTSHPNPWNYLARVPIILHGPGYIASGETSYEEVDITGLAPTYAQLLEVDGLSSATGPLPGAVERKKDAPPKVIFTVVIDGGGWNALQQHPKAWPIIRSLSRRGITYVNATIGSAPSITGALHATFGTGRYPLDHGLPGNQMRAPDGSNVDTWLQNADPRYLRLPTIAELWDESTGNQAVVATVSYEGWHLGMIGHGSQREGGDKDIAVLWEATENEWWINEDYYDLPDYLETTDLGRLESYEQELDERDGLADATWFGHSLEELQEDIVRPGTPAFVRFTGDAVIDVLRNEGIGDDAVPDMVWVEMKMPDYAGHAWNVVGEEQADVISETDRQIGRFIAELDRRVGRGRYVVAISADHGQQPLPELVGGWRINNKELERDIEATFGPVVEKITPVDIYLDRDRIDQDDVAQEDIARYIGAYTLEENIPPDAPGRERVPENRLEDRIFAGAFTTNYLSGLSPEVISSFGDGDYPEGDFTIERGR